MRATALPWLRTRDPQQVSTYDLRDSSHSVRDYKINCIRRCVVVVAVKRAHNHARVSIRRPHDGADWRANNLHVVQI